jgi:transcriptional regulator with PAS, ATPase and Fis domain
VRVIAATHRDLPALAGSGQFRQDLYYRVSEASVWLPPLRDRLEDIEILATRMLDGVREPRCVLREDGAAFLKGHAWPGNVRELRNVLRRAAALAGNGPIDAQLLSTVLLPAPSAGRPTPTEEVPVAAASALSIAQAREAHRKEYLTKLVSQYGSDHVAIARVMGVHIKHARRLMRKYGLVPGANA